MLLCSNVVKFFRREIGEIVRYLPDKKQTFGSFSNCRYCADCAQNLPGPAPTFGSQGSKFHPNRFTFGGVIAEHVKAVLLAHGVFPWFASNTVEANNNSLMTYCLCYGLWNEMYHNSTAYNEQSHRGVTPFVCDSWALVIAAVVQLSMYSCDLCDTRLSHQRPRTGTTSVRSTEWCLQMAGQSSGALCYDAHGLFVQLSLRISFLKQRQRSETDQTSDLQVVTRHLDSARLASCWRWPWVGRSTSTRERGRPAPRRWKPTDRRRYVNRRRRADSAWVTSACETRTAAVRQSGNTDGRFRTTPLNR